MPIRPPCPSQPAGRRDGRGRCGVGLGQPSGGGAGRPAAGRPRVQRSRPEAATAARRTKAWSRRCARPSWPRRFPARWSRFRCGPATRCRPARSCCASMPVLRTRPRRPGRPRRAPPGQRWKRPAASSSGNSSCSRRASSARRPSTGPMPISRRPRPKRPHIWPTPVPPGRSPTSTSSRRPMAAWWPACPWCWATWPCPDGRS